MNKFKNFLLFSSLFVSTFLFSFPSSSWHQGTTLFKIKHSAMSYEKMPILLYVYTDWCKYCKKMDKKLQHPKTEEALLGITKVSINPDKVNKQEYDEISKKYRITGYPTLILIYPNKSFKKLRVSHDMPIKSFASKLKSEVHSFNKKIIKKKKKATKEEIASIKEAYSEDGTAPQIIHFSDKKGEHSSLRAKRIVMENMDAKLNNDAGNRLLKKRRYKQAISKFYQALRYDKENQRTYYNLARGHFLYAKRSKGFQKLKLFRKAKSFIKIARAYPKGYGMHLDTLENKLKKAEAKENKKYKTIK